MALVNDSHVPGDFLVHIESMVKCLNYGQITMPAAGGPHTLTVNQILAYPLLAANVLAVAGDEANIVAFLIAGDAFEDLVDGYATIGPLYTVIDDFTGAVLNSDTIQAADSVGAAFNIANIMAAAGLADVKWVTEPVNTEEQVD